MVCAWHTAGWLLRTCPHIWPLLTSTSQLFQVSICSTWAECVCLHQAIHRRHPATTIWCHCLCSVCASFRLWCTHRRCLRWSRLVLDIVSICSAAVYQRWFIRRCPFALAVCWPLHKLSICNAHVQFNLRGGIQPAFGFGMGPCLGSAYATHMFCGCLSWWNPDALGFIALVTDGLSKSSRTRGIFAT